MKKLNDNEIFKKIPWVLIAIISITIIFTIITVIIQTKDYQSTEAYIFDIRFDGEYRISDGEWQPLSSAKHISSTDGRVELKGVFNLYASETDEEIGGAENGTIISLYLDHINATIRDSSGNEWISECENKQIGKSTCSEMWLEYIYEGNANEEVTIVLDNPHASGNTKAVDSFLKNLLAVPGHAGYRILIPCVCAQSRPTLRPSGLKPARLLCPWDFSRQEYWSGLSFPPPGDLSHPWIESMSPEFPELAGRFFTTEPPGRPS